MAKKLDFSEWKERARNSKRTSFKAALDEALLSCLVISAYLVDIIGKYYRRLGYSLLFTIFQMASYGLVS